MKKVVILILIIFIIIFIVLSFLVIRNDKKEKKENKNNINANDNSEIIKEQIVSGLKINNIVLSITEDGSSFTANVTNITNKEITGYLDIVFLTSTNKKYTNIMGYFGSSIKPGETKTITSSTSRRLTSKIVKGVEYHLINQN